MLSQLCTCPTIHATGRPWPASHGLTSAQGPRPTNHFVRHVLDFMVPSLEALHGVQATVVQHVDSVLSETRELGEELLTAGHKMRGFLGGRCHFAGLQLLASQRIMEVAFRVAGLRLTLASWSYLVRTTATFPSPHATAPEHSEELRPLSICELEVEQRRLPSEMLLWHIAGLRRSPPLLAAFTSTASRCYQVGCGQCSKARLNS